MKGALQNRRVRFIGRAPTRASAGAAAASLALEHEGVATAARDLHDAAAQLREAQAVRVKEAAADDPPPPQQPPTSDSLDSFLAQRQACSPHHQQPSPPRVVVPLSDLNRRFSSDLTESTRCRGLDSFDLAELRAIPSRNAAEEGVRSLPTFAFHRALDQLETAWRPHVG